MRESKYNTLIAFLLGTALGTAVGMLLAALYTPYSGEETRERIKNQSAVLKDRVVAESDDFSSRIRSATDAWVAQLQEVADDLVDQGKMTTEEARAQIDALLAKVRG